MALENINVPLNFTFNWEDQQCIREYKSPNPVKLYIQLGRSIMALGNIKVPPPLNFTFTMVKMKMKIKMKMMMLMMMMMTMMMMIVKYRRHHACTCPPVYSCVYLELVHTLPATWLGSIQGPGAYTVKSAAHGTAAGLQGDCQYRVRDSSTEIYMVAEQWPLDDTGQGELQYTRQQSNSSWERTPRQTWPQLEENYNQRTGTNYNHHTLQETTQHLRNGSARW